MTAITKAIEALELGINTHFYDRSNTPDIIAMRQALTDLKKLKSEVPDILTTVIKANDAKFLVPVPVWKAAKLLQKACEDE